MSRAPDKVEQDYLEAFLKLDKVGAGLEALRRQSEQFGGNGNGSGDDDDDVETLSCMPMPEDEAEELRQLIKELRAG